MPTPDKVEAVKKVQETLSKESPAEQMERVSPNKDHFQSLMDTQTKPVNMERIDSKPFSTEEIHSTESKPVFAEENVSSQKSGSATDQDQKRRNQSEEIEEVERAGSKKKTETDATVETVEKTEPVQTFTSATPESIKATTTKTISQIEKVKTTLSQTKAEIKPSYQTLLKNKLSHVDDNLKIALNKAGIEKTSAPQASEKANPIKYFIDTLSQSQNEMDKLQTSVSTLALDGNISPSNLLAIQIKMNIVQQQIELFTNLLNKALESAKTIMNVQV